MYAAANGMAAIHEMQAATANNIANAATNGFKPQAPVQMGFYQVFSETLLHPAAFKAAHAPGGGVRVTETYTHFAQGPARETGDPLHVALEGPGFIAVDTPEGERFTRDGAFTVDVDGHLATANGFKVLGAGGGPLDVRGGRVLIAEDGQVTVGGVPAGQIRVLEFENPRQLRRAGDNLFLAPETVLDASADGANTRVLQMRLESSNVNLPGEMINLMLGLRAYEANERSIRTADETTARLIDQVGMPR